MDQPTEEERLDFARSYGVEPVVPEDISFKEAATFVAEMTPIVGDAMAAKEIYDELMQEEPNYPLIAALGGRCCSRANSRSRRCSSSRT